MDVRNNNFDLLRLLAATQVVISHCIGHLGFISLQGLDQILSYFPGVPIFFVISGFLISASYERNPYIQQYAWSRALRIFPALWVCLFISILLAVIIGHVTFTVRQFIPWVIAQMSFLQIYNPNFLRGFGTGVLNGSLWTITVELQFYLALPLIYGAIHGKYITLKLIMMIIIFAIIYQYYINLIGHADIAKEIGPQAGRTSYKFFNFLLPTHLYLFLIGMLLQRNHKRLKPLIEGKGIIWLMAYGICVFSATTLGFSKTGNSLHILLATMLGFTVVALATTNPGLSKSLLGKNDISYGVYLYHMPIINTMMHIGAIGIAFYIIPVMGLTFLMAWLSWKWVEYPALKLKINPMRSYQATVKIAYSGSTEKSAQSLS